MMKKEIVVNQNIDYVSINDDLHYKVLFIVKNQIKSLQIVSKGETPIAPSLYGTDDLYLNIYGQKYRFCGWTTDGKNLFNADEVKIKTDTTFYASYRFIGFLPIKWKGYEPWEGYNIWSVGKYTFYSGDNDEQYYLDNKNHEWVPIKWKGDLIPHAGHIWTDGDTAYYSLYRKHDSKSIQYKFNIKDLIWEKISWNIDEIDKIGIWHDGDKVYYSYNNQHYQLDKEKMCWVKKQWINAENISGNKIWTDGNDIYFSLFEKALDETEKPINLQYVLNRETNTWIEKSWSDKDENELFGEVFGDIFDGIDASCIWQAKGKIYCTSLDDSFKFYRYKNKTECGVLKISGAMNEIEGEFIWSHLGEVYYSDGELGYQYKYIDRKFVPGFNDLGEIPECEKKFTKEDVIVLR